MDFQLIIDYLIQLLPALIVAFLAYYFFEGHLKDYQKERHYRLQLKNRDQSLPLILQAYERYSLFLERISPGRLFSRVKPVGNNKYDYENLLVQTIEQEFEHNLSQQVYVSKDCWRAIKASKNATINLIRQSTMSENITSAQKLQEHILTELLEKEPPSETGLSYIRSEVRKLT
ncbi:MAG: hypothetical protein RI558_09140 [Psychroflexus sp.]|jgi:predicted HTH transcriptional regulator|nr:hypothetical protein [Psychroflexus sp.]MDR9449351.1 hypothetical protein [Psychroflexus sp.]